MATAEETVGTPEIDEGFTHAEDVLADETVGTPEIDEGFTHAEDVLADGASLGPDPVLPDPDPVPVTSKELKDEAEEGEKESGKGGAHNLKSTLLISGAVVAVVGAIFAIARKIKEA